MELRQLRSFCAAGKLRSISKAADSLDIGQPTVTGHIKKLEAELGTLLFDRIKRPVQLTASGSTLLRLATPLVDGMDQLASGLSEADTMVPVRVASSHEIATHTLPPVVEAFLAEYPHVPLRIHSTGDRTEVLRAVAEAIEIGERSGAPVQISHLKAQGEAHWGRVNQAQALIEAAQDRG